MLSGKIASGSLPFSTKPQRRGDDDDLFQKSFSDAFDESDSLEVGKKEQEQVQKKKKGETNMSSPEDNNKQQESSSMSALGQGRAAHYNVAGPHFPSLFAGFDDLFARGDPFAHPFFGAARREPFFDSLMPVLRKNFPADPRATLLRSSPGYEIKESDGTYEIAIDIPEGIHASDMKVELEHDGTVLHLSGGHTLEMKKGKVYTSRFSKRFTIGPNVETDKLQANLSDGVLVLTAPKIVKALERPKKQTIVVTENAHVADLPTDQEVIQKDYSVEVDESDRVEKGKKEE